MEETATEPTGAIVLNDLEAETVEALLANPGPRAVVAKALGISERGLRHRLLEHPRITEAIREHRRGSIRALAGQAERDAADALKVLREAMSDAEAGWPSRIAAARLVLEITLKLHEVDDLQDRMEQLEAVVNEGAEP